MLDDVNSRSDQYQNTLRKIVVFLTENVFQLDHSSISLTVYKYFHVYYYKRCFYYSELEANSTNFLVVTMAR